MNADDNALLAELRRHAKLPASMDWSPRQYGNPTIYLIDAHEMSVPSDGALQ